MTRTSLILAAATMTVAASTFALADPRGGDGGEGDCTIRKITPNWQPGTEGEWGDTLGILATTHDGRYVAYSSYTTLFLPNADQMHGHIQQIIVRDTVTQEGELISVAYNPADGESIAANAHNEWYLDISPNGRYVAFASLATNLVPEKVSGQFYQTYVRDRQEGVTYLVSRSVDGEPANDWGSDVRMGVSNNGRVAFAARANNLHPDRPQLQWAVYVYDVHTNELQVVSRDTNGTVTPGPAWGPSISADGNVVAFVSPAPLVPGLPFQSQDVYVHDLTTGMTEIVSVDSNGNNRIAAGGYFPRISHDGNRVAFKYDTPSDGLDPAFPSGWFEAIYVRDRAANRTTAVNINIHFQGATTNPEGGFTLSGDGKYVAWDTIDQITDEKVNHIWHVYRTNVDTRESELITRDRWCQPIPEQHDLMYSAISGDGRHVVFNSMWHVMYDDDFDWSRHLYMWVDPSPQPGPLGDLNGDGYVDVSDLLILLNSWGLCQGDCPADLNNDGFVDVSDLLVLFSNWG